MFQVPFRAFGRSQTLKTNVCASPPVTGFTSTRHDVVQEKFGDVPQHQSVVD